VNFKAIAHPGVLTAIGLFSLGSLLAGPDYLLWPLPGGLPLGNLLALLCLCVPAALALSLSKPGSACRFLSRMAVVLALLWLPVSIALAGNLDLIFIGTRGIVWLWLSLVTACYVLAMMAWAMAAALLGRRKRKSAA